MNEFELERELSRTEIATYLRKLADGLEEDNKVTFVVGDESATINPPEQVHARMETKTDSSWLGSDNGHSFLLELGWQPITTDEDQELTIITQPRSTRRQTDESAAETQREDEPDESDRAHVAQSSEST